jgi:hypothetical protein
LISSPLLKMRRLFVALLLSALCAAVPAFAQKKDGKDVAPPAKEVPQPQVAWSSLGIEQKRILAPLEKDWSTLPGLQQQRLVSATKRYPTMRPIQQERFQERIKEWAQLSPEQRKAARETYKDLSKLPPEKQHALRERWQAKQAQSTQSPPSTPPAN